MPFETPFGFHSTAEAVIAGVDLSGRHALITGGASGIGLETTRVLALAGADVTVAVRDAAAAGRALSALDVPAGRLRIATLDLSSRASIDTCARSWHGPLHVLINNAGVMAPPRRHTPEGWDVQFVVNHLGHFALAGRLHHALTAAGGARVVVLSSSSHQVSPVVFDDIHFDRRPYDPIGAYAQSKTANALFAIEAARRWAGDGIAVNALMPGAIPTPLQRHVGGMKTPLELRKTVAQGAATSVLLAASPLVEGISGRYFADCQEARRLAPGEKDMAGVAPHAIDPDAAARLWGSSLRMVDAWGGAAGNLDMMASPTRTIQ
jgi:NAD(P)-dependent dehydrogenase (short-subunit alcohol dehydrogenase family)